MSATQPWLTGRHALVVGAGAATDAVARSLAAAGATVQRDDPALADAPEIAAAFAAAAGSDILVHAGSCMPPSAPESLDLAGWRATASADLDGRFLFAAEFARICRAAARPGAILFLMPSAALAPGRAAILTAHGALDNLVKSLAVEWGRDGLRVNAIASHVVERFAAATPAQQSALGNLAAYLVSDYAAYMTGCIAGIDES